MNIHYKAFQTMSIIDLTMNYDKIFFALLKKNCLKGDTYD